LYCVHCGAQNPDDAFFCRNCGSNLVATQNATSSSRPATAPSIPGGVPPPRDKIPLIAALLNVFFGVGYFYLGYKRVLGVPTALFVLVMLILDIIGVYLTFGILALLLVIIFAYDGFQKADGEKGIIGVA
jgi:hypothetical protein